MTNEQFIEKAIKFGMDDNDRRQVIQRLQIMNDALKVSEETCICPVPKVSGVDTHVQICPMGVGYRVRKELDALT